MFKVFFKTVIDINFKKIFSKIVIFGCYLNTHVCFEIERYW